jgi:hypothetical protein
MASAGQSEHEATRKTRRCPVKKERLKRERAAAVS